MCRRVTRRLRFLQCIAHRNGPDLYPVAVISSVDFSPHIHLYVSIWFYAYMFVVGFIVVYLMRFVTDVCSSSDMLQLMLHEYRYGWKIESGSECVLYMNM